MFSSCRNNLFDFHDKSVEWGSIWWQSLKSDSHLPKKSFIWFNESPLKLMKNAFYFILKVFFVFKIFKFLSWLFSYIEKNGLTRKIKLISKFMTSQPGQQTIAIHILPNISRSKGNQAIKFGQVIEDNKTKFFFEKCPSGSEFKFFVSIFWKLEEIII